LEAHFRELEAFKRQEERRKKDAEKRFKQQCIQEKRDVHRAFQQAQREANARDTEVQRLIRQLEKVQSEQERQRSRQGLQQDKLEEALRKLREERNLIEQQYEVKLAESGEARGRLDLMDKVLRRDQSRTYDDMDVEVGMERAEQELVKAEIAQTRLRIQSLSHDNGRLRQELVELRSAVAAHRPKAVDIAPLASGNSKIITSFEVLPVYSPATTSAAAATYQPSSASGTTSTGFPTHRYSAAVPSTVSTVATARSGSAQAVTESMTSTALVMRPNGGAAVMLASPSSNVPRATELIATGAHEKWNRLRGVGLHQAGAHANDSSFSSAG
jgi:myosin heavy subunit